MAEVSWIKLKVGMFDDSKIKYIEALPERDTIITVWVKLLTLAGKYNEQGYIMLSENLPYNDEMLANEFNRPINSIRLALQTFETLGMIEDVQGIYKVTNWEKHQNIEGLEKIREQNRLRKQRQRYRELGLDMPKPEDKRTCAYCGENATTLDHIIPKSKGGTDTPDNIVDCCKSCNSSKKDKDLQEFINDSETLHKKIKLDLILKNPKLKKHVTRDVTGQVTQSHATDIDKELEEDKEIDKDDVFKISINYIMDNLSNNLTPNQMELIGYSIDDIGEQADEVVKIAVDYTKEKGSHVGYLIQVLNNWAKENVKTKEDAQNKVKPKQQVKGTLLDDILNEE